MDIKSERMTIQEQLMDIRDADAEIETLRLSMFDAWLQATRITAELDGISVQSTPEPHKYDTIAILDSAIGDRLRRLNAQRARAIELIGDAPTSLQRQVLMAYYVDCRAADGRRKTWDMVAAQLHLSARQAQRVASDAITALEVQRCR